MNYNPDLHHRRSIRLKNYDYSQAGAYFVTICIQNKECLFGAIEAGKMSLNEYGQVTTTCWRDLPVHYPQIELDEFVIMPNHTHGIIVINHVGAGFKPAHVNPDKTYQTPKIRAGLKPAPTLKSHGLPEIIRAFKTFSSKHINQIRNSPGVPVWQRNYYGVYIITSCTKKIS
jgi:REP element-mobilizing transposase RayT